jgi:hypothetical protein
LEATETINFNPTEASHFGFLITISHPVACWLRPSEEAKVAVRYTT